MGKECAQKQTELNLWELVMQLYISIYIFTAKLLDRDIDNHPSDLWPVCLLWVVGTLSPLWANLVKVMSKSDIT